MRKYLIIVLGAILLAGCKKHNDAKPAPDKVKLVLPAQSSACTTGTVISVTQSAITFSWNTSANTDTYEIGVKNLLTQIIAYQSTSSTQLSWTLLRNTPYSWFVVSKSKTSTDTAKSDIWKFYNAGSGTIAYAPFPAELTSPTLNQNITATAGGINLTWNGSSIDNDIVGYDVYFGIIPTPPLFKANVTNMFLNTVSVTSGTTYYWKVVTKDLPGNTSDSGTFVFKVN
jgi:hypothetical protein